MQRSTQLPAELPEEVWKLVFQHVPQKQRLQSCALVCSKLNRAAAAATQSLRCFSSTADHFTAVLCWINKHGCFLTSLELSPPPNSRAIQQLPCPALKELCFSHCSVQLGASSSHPGVLQSCRHLTKLELYSAALLDLVLDSAALTTDPQAAAKQAGITATTPAPQLRHLQLCRLKSLPSQLPSASSSHGHDMFEARLLPHLTSLTYLHLQQSTSVQLVIKHISCMVGLQELNVCEAGDLTPTTLPGMQCLTALTHLNLCWASLQPLCLLELTPQLQRFSLRRVELTSAGPPNNNNSQAASQQLLQVLARLTNLQHLDVEHLAAQQPQDLTQCSALTASSQLQEVSLFDCSLFDNAWQYVFQAQRKLPDLRSFAACNMLGQGSAQAPAPFSESDIDDLISCCPGLQELRLPVKEDEDEDVLMALQDITGLTRLEVGGMGPTAAQCHLPQLTQLRELHVIVANGLDPAGRDAVFSLSSLMPLTALKGLTVLDCDIHADLVDRYDDRGLDTDDFCVIFDNQAGPDAPPNVWMQLLAHCATGSNQPVVVRALLEQLEEQQEQLRQQQEQLWQQQEQLTVQSDHLAQQQEQLAEAAETRVEVQALKEQVQQLMLMLHQQQQVPH